LSPLSIIFKRIVLVAQLTAFVRWLFPASVSLWLALQGQ